MDVYYSVNPPSSRIAWDIASHGMYEITPAQDSFISLAFLEPCRIVWRLICVLGFDTIWKGGTGVPRGCVLLVKIPNPLEEVLENGDERCSRKDSEGDSGGSGGFVFEGGS